MTHRPLGYLALALLVAAGGASRVLADDGLEHRLPQPRPILLGTSGSNMGDSSRLFCCGGTLGAAVEDASGRLYILSNNHVLARTNKGVAGDPIVQPGLIDRQCAEDQGEQVAALTRFVPIRFKGNTNTVDAAIAEALPGTVAADGGILDLGSPSSETLEATVGLAVAKSGRTTGMTLGSVQAVNVTVDVAYDKQCGQGQQVARFVGQIFISPGTFSAGGDSGALVVEDVGGSGAHPRAVGLLFAGSDAGTLANPIDAVLESTCVAMPGAASFPDPAGCAGGDGGGGNGGKGGPPPGKGKNRGLRGFGRAVAAQARHQETLLGHPGVVAVGIGATRTHAAVIEVYVTSTGTPVPRRLDGVPVRVVQSGSFVAF